MFKPVESVSCNRSALCVPEFWAIIIPTLVSILALKKFWAFATGKFVPLALNLAFPDVKVVRRAGPKLFPKSVSAPLKNTLEPALLIMSKIPDPAPFDTSNVPPPVGFVPTNCKPEFAAPVFTLTANVPLIAAPFTAS